MKDIILTEIVCWKGEWFIYRFIFKYAEEYERRKLLEYKGCILDGELTLKLDMSDNSFFTHKDKPLFDILMSNWGLVFQVDENKSLYHHGVRLGQLRCGEENIQ